MVGLLVWQKDCGELALGAPTLLAVPLSVMAMDSSPQSSGRLVLGGTVEVGLNRIQSVSSTSPSFTSITKLVNEAEGSRPKR